VRGYERGPNDDDRAIQLSGWTLRDEANHVFTFPNYVTEPSSDAGSTRMSIIQSGAGLATAAARRSGTTVGIALACETASGIRLTLTAAGKFDKMKLRATYRGSEAQRFAQEPLPYGAGWPDVTIRARAGHTTDTMLPMEEE
jgi:hypothetical protein